LLKINFLYLVGFQDSATSIMEGIVDLHNYIFYYLVLVVIFVLYMLTNIVYYFYYQLYASEQNKETLVYRYNLLEGNRVTHGTVLEIVWTSIPSIILMLIAIPSFALLYSIDEVVLPGLILKVIGHQWYWSYEYSDYTSENFSNSNRVKFDSYMISEEELKLGQLRLLEVDNVIVLPTDVHVRVLVTASDVLHSWAVPSLGVKVDAVPGRLSQANVFIKREGVFYGQCSEICGVNHGFMPIVVVANGLDSFHAWATQKA
jgi:cytochrome c oxidase subunit 2